MEYIVISIYRKLVLAKLKQFVRGLRRLSRINTWYSNINEINKLKNDLLYIKILQYYEYNDSKEYQNELEYLKKHGALTPYLQKRTYKEPPKVNTGFDKKKKMSFVLHKNKKLYFPEHYSKEDAKRVYLNLIIDEDILGSGFKEKNFHQYTTESFCVKNNDILLDVGACEGLFLLDMIDKVSKGFIIESNKNWIKALKVTFEPYKDKITIINKFASNKDSQNEITIDTCLKNEFGSIFIKMDIEGCEYSALCGAEKVLTRKDDIRVSCCTYHYHDDSQLIEKFFKDIGYKTEFSVGYTLFNAYDEMKPPFFRRGLIRARNIY